MVKPRVDDETRSEKFKRIAAGRTQRILVYLRRLGNCSNKSRYEYSKDDISKIFSAIDQELRKTKSMFNTPGGKKFSL